MIKEINEVIVGFDLGRNFSLITFYNHKISDPITISTEEGQEKYLIPTPRDIFPLVEGKKELGDVLLSNFFKECFEMLGAEVLADHISIMVTMEKMEEPWVSAIPSSLAMLDIPRSNVFLQDYRESFFYFTLNQKKELWNYKVALFEYEDSKITAFELDIDYKTRPALVRVTKMAQLVLDKKVRRGKKDSDWDLERDRLFLGLIQKIFANKIFSSTYLIGDNFDKTWAVRSLQYLCNNRRHVFQGRNLYTKGACYGAMQRKGLADIGDYLYVGEDMVEVNVGMQMQIRGKESYYLCLNAGMDWYEAYHTYELILDDTDELILYFKPIDTSPARTHSIFLEGLPARPNKTTRLEVNISFLSVHKCRVFIRDLGFGGLFPAYGKSWEEIIDV